MIWAISWRNVWRNKLRSAVIIISVAIGIFAGVFSWAFYAGMVDQRIQTAIITEASNIQIHEKNFLENPDQKFYMANASGIANDVRAIEEVRAVSERLIVNAMATSAETGSGVKIMGIDPEKEKNVTNIYSKVMEGSYFEDEGKTPVVIGEKLAEKLSIKLRSRIVLTLQNMDGTITSGLFRVEGIYRTANSVYDETNIFIKHEDVINLIGLNESAGHEIAILLHDNNKLDDVCNLIQSSYPELDIKTWKELMPDVSLVEETMNFSMYIFMAIILAALVFGIVNTMLMAVLERVKELGMLMAVGMNKIRVFTMIVLETVFLSIQGGVIGIIIAYLVTLIFNRRGIDLSPWIEGFEKLGYEAMVYPATNAGIAVRVAIMVLIAGIVASVYPAIKALQLKPAEALHIDI
ncbi:MAG: ABC transporter permease [Bacteroidales bacterium]|nr:ABC transporter permease [Bacteroidales bacterium]